MSRATRILAVTGGLILTGALLGGIAGAAALGVSLAITEGLGRQLPGALLFGGILGAAIGSVAAPLAGWILLRRVPLGRAIGWTTLGAVAGGVIGWLLRLDVPGPVPAPIAGALVGFLIPALILRLRTPASSAPAGAGGAGGAGER
jgi:hypothetical protein